MAVAFSAADIPATVFLELMKAEILPQDETPEIVPLTRSFLFLSLPSLGFIVTNKNAILYKSGVIGGVKKVREIPLTDIAKLTYIETKEGVVFRFNLKDESEQEVTLALSQKDLDAITRRFEELVSDQV